MNLFGCDVKSCEVQRWHIISHKYMASYSRIWIIINYVISMLTLTALSNKTEVFYDNIIKEDLLRRVHHMAGCVLTSAGHISQLLYALLKDVK